MIFQQRLKHRLFVAPTLLAVLFATTPAMAQTTAPPTSPPPDSAFESVNPFGPTPTVPAPTPAPPAPMPVAPQPTAPGSSATTINFQQGNPFSNAPAPKPASGGSLTKDMLINSTGVGQGMDDISLLTLALEARSQGDIERARIALQQLVSRDPSSAQYKRLLQELDNPIYANPGTSKPLAKPPPTTAPIPTSPGGDPMEQLEGNLPTVIPGEGASLPPGTTPGQDVEMSALDDLSFDDADIAKLLGSQGVKEKKQALREARDELKVARRMIQAAEFAEANLQLNRTRVSLESIGGESDPESAKILEEVKREIDLMLLYKAEDDMENGLFELAMKAIEDYEKDRDGPTKESLKLQKKLKGYQSNPYKRSIDKVSPDFISQQADLHNLLIRARTQIVNGDRDGALETYREIEMRYPYSSEAKYYQTLIANELHKISHLDRQRTRNLLLSQISRGWTLPQVIDRALEGGENVRQEENPVLKKIKAIMIPKINLSGIELTRAIEFLSEASQMYDFSTDQIKGVNIIPNFDPNEEDPRVNLNLRNLTLERILEVLTNQVNYEYVVSEDAVIISKSKTSLNANYIMEFFPVSRPTVLKLTGGAGGGDPGGGGGGGGDPFAPMPGGGAALGGGGGGEEQAMKDFFIRAGIPLQDPDASFAFDGTQIIVRHSQRVIQRIRDILRRYDTQQTQVEIEAKFLEVQQGDLEELGFDWTLNWGVGKPTFDTDLEPILDSTGEPVMEYPARFTPSNRNLFEAFTFFNNSSMTTISRQGEDPMEFPNPPPTLPNTLDLAHSSKEFFRKRGLGGSIMGKAQVDVVIRALQRSSGTELLSAPKLTVNDQGTANITVAQEFLYPDNYSPGDISQNGSGFTGSTPSGFQTRNIGVELSVTPQVQPNDIISLHLEPSVTEFEGFVEYGGNNVVISGGNQGGNQGGGFGGFGGGFGGSQNQTVIVQPSGIYQPIFSVRQVVTDVTIYDGATVMIGGLTREEVKTVNDSVPILGNIPGIGRLFRSEGESSLKRNLIIFVTGNIISPGGGPARQDLATIERGSMFQNPIIITPAGPEMRLRKASGTD